MPVRVMIDATTLTEAEIASGRTLEEIGRARASARAHRAPAGEDPYPDLPHPAEAEQSETSRRVLRLLDRGELADLPSPHPLVAATLDLGTVAVLGGYWGTCKSFVAQDWAACIATGKAWLGRPVERRRVLYVAAEGAQGLHGRWQSWEIAWRTNIEPGWLTVLPDAVALSDHARVADLALVVRERGFGVVVLDTLAKCAVGLDENSARDMGVVVSALYRLRSATIDGTLIAVHHTGKDKATLRGSSAIEGGVDTVYQIEGDPHCLTLHRTKRKDGPRDDALTLRLDAVPGTDSAVLASATADMTRNDEALLSVFVSAFSETGASKAELRNAAGLSPASFARSLNALVRRGLLVNRGTEQRPFYRAPAGE